MAADIDSLWNAYTERMAEIELFQRATKDIASSELNDLFRSAEQVKSYPKGESLSVSFHNMTFREPRTGRLHVYRQKELDLDTRKSNVLFRKNRQYQWLLAEAYEEFEDYIHNLYAYCGSTNSDFWPLSDYGSITLSNLKDKPFPWYVERSRLKKGAPHSILVRFREVFPAVRRVEVENTFEVNLAVAVALIEKLRHIIVHNSGKAFSKRKFIESVAKQTGLYNNGHVTEDIEGFINQFFGAGEYENLVALLEIQIRPDLPFENYICRFGDLTNYLLAYGFLLYQSAKFSVSHL
ncbi:MAG: hypothetical protein WCV99_18510 [Sterolibacterium sp.]|jgi:hypothetical protein